MLVEVRAGSATPPGSGGLDQGTRQTAGVLGHIISFSHESSSQDGATVDRLAGPY